MLWQLRCLLHRLLKAGSKKSSIQLTPDSNKEELVVKLNAEDEGFKQLLTRAGLNTEFSVLEQIDGNQDGRVTWQEFYDKLGNAATKEVEAQGDLVAATEIKIEDEATSKSLCC